MQSLTMASRAMKLKGKGKDSALNMTHREISARRQVGDAETMVNQVSPEGPGGMGVPWWKNVGMDEL